MGTGKVNQRITAFLKRREMTLEDLSSRTGLDIDFLKSMEDGNIHPPLGPLLKIARALGVRLGTFLDDQENKNPVVIHEGDREEELNVMPGKDQKVGHRFYSLGKGKTDRHMEPFFVEILPDASSKKKLSAHEGEEFIVVQSGSVEVIYGQETHILNTGDSIYYDSVVPHYVSCAGNETASIYAVLYIPE